MKIAVIIPARFKSSRFPGKPLADISGKPMVIHVAEKADLAIGRENVWVATEDQRIFDVVTSYGFQAVMTTDFPLTGTDRLFEASQQIKADIYLNIQGDEPVLNPTDIRRILDEKIKNMDYVINGMAVLSDSENPDDINIPKVVINKNSELLYMSRLAVPGIKDKKSGMPIYRKQVCIYAFSPDQLSAFGNSMGKAEYEKFEDIEILRFFDLGIKIKMVETSGFSLAVDNPEDIQKVEDFIKVQKNKI